MKKNRILYFSLLMLSLSFIYFYGGKVPYTLFYTVGILPMVSFIMVFIAFIRFKYTQEIDKRIIVKGDEVNFTFSIHNEDFFLYPYIKVIFHGAETVFEKQFQSKSFSLHPFKRKSFTYKLVGKYRGEYEVGIKKFEFQDYLGLFKLTYKPMESKMITVNPRIVELDNLHIKTNSISESHSIADNRYQEDMSTISDIRKYAYGDSLKKIHWKLSAKMNTLLVKNYESTSSTDSVIVLDLKSNKYGIEQNTMIEDKLIEGIVAVVYYCLKNWFPINLIYYKNNFIDIEAKNALQFEQIYEFLSKVRFNQTIAVKDLLEIYIKNNIKKADILLFTSDLSYELYEELYKAKLYGYTVNLIYISPEKVTGVCDREVQNILEDLPEKGIKTYVINTEDDIKEILENKYS